MSSQTFFKTAGATSQSIEVALVQDAGATSPGNALTGLAYNSAGLTAYYKINGTGTLTAITLATQTDTGAYSSGGFVETSSTNAPGAYRFDLPNAVIATAGIVTIVFKGATDLATHHVTIICLAVDLFTNVYVSANTTHESGVSLSSTGTGAIYSRGILDQGTAQAGGAATITLRSAASFADNVLTGCVVIIRSGTGVNQSRMITANVGSTDVVTVSPAWSTQPDATSIYLILAAPVVPSDLPMPANMVQLGSDTQSATDLKDFADAGYDPATNKVQGVVLTDTVTTYTGNTPQTGDSFARLGAPAGASVSADIAAIEAQTDDIGVAGAGLTALASAANLATVAGYLDTEIAAIKAKTDSLTFTVANVLDANIQRINDVAVTGDGQPGTEFDV